MPTLAARSILLAAGVAGLTVASSQTRTIYSLTVPTEIAHDSNPSMSVSGSPGTTFVRVRPNLVARYVDGTEEYSVDATLSAEKSSNTAVAEDRLDPSVRGAWKHQDERNTVEAAAFLDRRAFRSVDLREQVPTGVDGSRTLFGVSGRWARDLDERTAFSTDIRQDWARYSQSSAPDYRHTTGAVRLTRQQTERTSWYVGANGQLYRPEEGGGTRSTVAGTLVGARHAFSEAFSIDGNARWIRFTEPTHKNDWQGALTAEYSAERWRAALDVARSPSVNSTFGRLVVSEALRVRTRYDLSPVSRLEFDAGHSREKAVQSRRTLTSVAYVRELSPSWEVSVRASLQRQQDVAGTAKSRVIGVLLTYRAPDL